MSVTLKAEILLDEIKTILNQTEEQTNVALSNLRTTYKKNLDFIESNISKFADHPSKLRDFYKNVVLRSIDHAYKQHNQNMQQIYLLRGMQAVDDDPTMKTLMIDSPPKRANDMVLRLSEKAQLSHDHLNALDALKVKLETRYDELLTE